MTEDHPIIAAITSATKETLSTMALLEMEVEAVSPETSLASSLDYTATMGLCGDSEGLLLVSLETSLANQIVAAMLGMGEDEIEDDLVDGIGEIANMVAGSAKTALSGGPHAFELSIPATMVGAKNQISPKSGTPGAVIRCRVEEKTMLLGIWMQGL